MNKRIKQSLLYTFLVMTGVVYSHSPAFSEGMTLKIEEPTDAWLKFTGEKIASNGPGLHTPPNGVGDLTADIKMRAHCNENFGVIGIHLLDEQGNNIIPGGLSSGSDDPPRTRYHTFEAVPIAAISYLKSQCRTVPDGGAYGALFPIRVKLDCFNPLEYLGMDLDGTDWKYKTYDLEFPLKVTCYLGRAYATVEDEYWTYSCPETPGSNESYWQTYRLVVDGTDSHQVRTSSPLNNPDCVTISQSNGSKMDKVIWKAE